MADCLVCGGNNFSKHEGYFYCNECNTQSQVLREIVHDQGELGLSIQRRTPAGTRRKKKKIQPYEIGPKWTTWEALNYVLWGMTEELISAGAPEEMRSVVLHIWATYLNQLKAGFTSKEKELLPRLSFPYSPRDANVIHDVNKVGKIYKKKSRRRKRKKSATSVSSSTLTSRQLKKKMIDSAYESHLTQSSLPNTSDNDITLEELGRSGTDDDEKETIRIVRKSYMTKKGYATFKKCKSSMSSYRKYRVHLENDLNVYKLLLILVLALYVTRSEIQIADLLRFLRDGHLTFQEASRFLPPELKLVRTDLPFINEGHERKMPALTNLRHRLERFRRRLKLKFPVPDVYALLRRYAIELQLPDTVAEVAVNVLRIIAKNVHMGSWHEGMVMASLLITLKLLLGLNNSTEYMYSHIADNINRLVDEDKKLFSFLSWQKMITCRYTVLSKWHQPTRYALEPTCRFDPESARDFLNVYPRDLYLRERIGNSISNIHVENKIFEMLKKLPSCDRKLHSKPVFHPSLTPDVSNIEVVIQHLRSTGQPKPKWVDLLQHNWRNQNIEYLLNKEYATKIIHHFGMCENAVSMEQWLKDHLGTVKKTEDLLDVLTVQELEPKHETRIRNIRLPLSKHKLRHHIQGRWKAAGSFGNVAHTRRDHHYWCLHVPTNTSFHKDIHPKLPKSWVWLLTVCSSILMCRTKDVQNIVNFCEERFLRHFKQISKRK